MGGVFNPFLKNVESVQIFEKEIFPKLKKESKFLGWRSEYSDVLVPVEVAFEGNCRKASFHGQGHSY